jgi:hypothetical protein
VSTEPYRIRLRGPWEVAWRRSREPRVESQESRVESQRDRATPDSDAGSAPEFDTQYLPAAWRELFGEEAGSARFRRRFNRPTNLGPQQRVSIVLQDVAGGVSLWINRHPVAAAKAQERAVFDVTEHLEDYNLLEVEIAFDPAHDRHSPGGLWQPVLLEISPAE